jgi:hypothetical protein
MYGLCENVLPPPAEALPAVPRRRSLHEAALAEASRYKWLESEKAGRDLGDSAIRDWVRNHWRPFVRQCWIDHLEGRVFWSELDRGDFGLFLGPALDVRLVDDLRQRIRRGAENLDILCWYVQQAATLDEMRALIELLERLDINGHRVEPQVACVRSRAG